MPKDREQMTPDEPEDEARLESSRGPGRGSTGQDVLAGDASAPGPAAGSGDPPAADEVEAGEKSKYR
jgi:hypothetical protein